MIQYIEILNPPSLNKIVNQSRTNRFKAAAEKKKWTKHIASLAVDLQPMSKAWVAVEWVYKRTNSDPDNALSGILKLTLDGLVKAEVLPQDTVKEVLSPMHYSYTKGDRNSAKVLLFDNFDEYRTYILLKLESCE